MGKITKKILEKHFKGMHKKTRKKKTLGKEIDEHVKSIAMAKLEAHGCDCMDSIIIDNVSIEICSEDPEGKELSGKSAGAAFSGDASTSCIYYCYVIGGRRICRKVCW